MTIPTTVPSNGRTPQAIPLANPASGPVLDRNLGLAQAGDSEEREIPLADIDPDPNQPRREFDPERDEELMASMQEHDLLNAIIVTLVLATSRYRIIAGERRWRAAKTLGWKTIRACVLKDQPDETKRRELALIDNEQRQDLASEVERGMAYHDLMTRTGCSARELAKKVGKHVGNVTRAIKRAQSLSSALQERIQAGTLPPSIAQELLALPDADAQLAVARQYPDPLKTRAEVIAAIRSFKHGGNGHSAASASSFTCQDQESGVKIAVTFPGQDLGRVEAVLRQLVKDLSANGYKGLEKFKEYLSKKARAAQKQAELKAAQDDLAGLTNPAPSIPPLPAGGGKKE